MKNIGYRHILKERSIETLRKSIMYFSLFTLSFFTLTASAQIGTWSVYPAYTICNSNIVAGNRIYCIMEGRLMAYDTDDGSITTFDWLQQLSDITVSFIRYSAEAKRIIIIYDNGNIDLLSTEDDYDVINLAQLKNSNLLNKDVNNVQVMKQYAYICTNFGVVVVDMAQGFIKESYELGLKVRSCALTEKNLFIGTSTGLWRGTLNTNLKDKNNWKHLETYFNAAHMETFAGNVWIHVGTYLVVMNDDEETWTTLQAGTLNPIPDYMTVNDGKLIIGSSNKILIYENKNKVTALTGYYYWNCLTVRGNEYWASFWDQGLQSYKLNEQTFELTRANIHPNSPTHNYSFHLRFAGKRLMVAGGNRHFANTELQGLAMLLEPDGHTWTIFDGKAAIEKFPKYRWLDVTNIAQDPHDENHYYVGTTRNGVFEFRDMQCVGHLGLENAPLHSILPNNEHKEWYTVADGLIYDPEGNLWLLNPIIGKQDTTVRIMRPDGTWTGIPCPEINSASTVDNIFFDSRGWAWLNSRRMTQRGILMLDYNGTIDNSKDDHRMFCDKIVNQDNVSYAPDNFYYINEDLDGSIWICTDMGPFRITTPEDFAAGDLTFEQVKVARTDGSGLADYLLSGLVTQCVAIDGAGRKWFGTDNNGVYVVSEDCQEELAHYTVENSPLPSNNIYDIAIHPATGHVFFATDKGLCSYFSDASESADGLDKDNIYAFPNPVEPDYNGPIGIRGLVKDSEVKIVSATGQLIWTGTSIGGTFTWNGCNRFGKRVASGVYIVIANTPDGKNAATTKITFIK